MIQSNKMMTILLDNACGEPVDEADFYAYQIAVGEVLTKEEENGPVAVPPYSGWQRFTVQLHCVEITIIAKHAKNGGWIIKNYSKVDAND